MSHSTTGFARRASQRPRPRRGWGWAAGLALTVLGAAFTGAGQAQDVTHGTLDNAVRVLVKELVEEGELKGRRVFAGRDDFFEEGSGLRLPLSGRLSDMCKAALKANGARVVVTESTAVSVLRGRWRYNRSEERIHLTLSIAEPVETGEPEELAYEVAYASTKLIPEVDLTPTLDHWGPELVRRLEREAHDHRKRDVRLQPITVEGDVGQPDRLEQLLATWLRDAFGGMRRNRLYTLVEDLPDLDTASVETHGTLSPKATVDAESVVVSLAVHDKGGRLVAATRVTLNKGLFPPGSIADSGPRRFRAKVRAVVSEGLDREGAIRAMRNLARARVVAQALGGPPPSIDVVRSEADGVRALTRTLGRGIPVDERFSEPRPDGAGGLEAELEARVVEVGATARPRVEASLDKNELRAKEPIRITLSAEEVAHAAVFAWGADDRVVRLYPNPKAPDLALEAGSRVTLPRAGDFYQSIWSEPMPGNDEDHEVFLVLASGGRLAVDGLAPFVGESPEKMMQAAVSGAGFFDALGKSLDPSRLALIVLPYRVTAR